MVKEIDILSLPLYPKYLFKSVKRDRLIIINNNKSIVYKDGLLRLRWGSIWVVDMGNSNVEFGHAQGLVDAWSGRRRGSFSAIDIATANRLTKIYSGFRGYRGILRLTGRVLRLLEGYSGHAWRPCRGVVNPVTEGARGIRCQGGVEKSIGCYGYLT
jgi:hypothetical protein